MGDVGPPFVFGLLPGRAQFPGPLVVWLIKKDEFPFVDEQGKEALNFHICVLIVAAIAIPAILCFFIGLVLLVALGIYVLVMTIIAVMKANQGIYYRYPLNFRMIK